jgi:hypothetical protein
MPVDRHLLELELLAIEPECAVAARRRRIAAQLQEPPRHACDRIQLESEIDVIDQELGRTIIFAMDRVRRVAIHDDP